MVQDLGKSRSEHPRGEQCSGCPEQNGAVFACQVWEAEQNGKNSALALNRRMVCKLKGPIADSRVCSGGV